MNKKELFKSIIDFASGVTGTKKTKEEIAKLAFSALVDAITRDDQPVDIPGLGRMHVKRLKSRTYRNPATGDAVEKPERLTLKFKPTKAAIEELNRRAGQDAGK